MEYVILNVEGSNEEFSFWIDNLRGADVTQQAYYTHQTEACKIVAEGIKNFISTAPTRPARRLPRRTRRFPPRF
ncbi:MAG: hypothetical protein ACLRSW_04195 [Christensenellaceae bacterium]